MTSPFAAATQAPDLAPSSSPFTMVGETEAGLCVDGVCAVPEADAPTAPEAPPAEAPSGT